MPGDGRKQRKVAAVIQREIASLIIKGVKDPRLAESTILHVEVSDDLSRAKVYFTAHKDSDLKKILKGFNSAKGYLRSELAHHMKSRRVPELFFYYDESVSIFEALIRERVAKGEVHELTEG